MRKSFIVNVLASLVLLGAVRGPQVSILIDLDPNSAAQTVIVESIAADAKGMLYVCDRVTGNVWRIDPKKPALVVVGRVAERKIGGKSVRADASGIVFNQDGDLFIASGPFAEVLKIRSRALDPKNPGVAETFATATEGANGVAIDRNGNLFVSGGRNGAIYRTGREGGKAEIVAMVPPHTRTLPDGKTQQSITANGLVFDADGTILYIADTARGAVWRLPVAGNRSAQPSLVVQSALLEGADGPAFDPRGNLWVAANERNAVVIVTTDGKVLEVAKNGSKGPLEFPTAVVFVNGTAYISNFDTPRRDNLAADGSTSLDGIGASIVKIEP